MESILNAFGAWMILEPQAMIKDPHPHCGSPLPPSEAGRIASGDGDTSFSALLSCTPPPKGFLFNPPLSAFLLLYSLPGTSLSSLPMLSPFGYRHSVILSLQRN